MGTELRSWQSCPVCGGVIAVWKDALFEPPMVDGRMEFPRSEWFETREGEPLEYRSRWTCGDCGTTRFPGIATSEDFIATRHYGQRLPARPMRREVLEYGRLMEGGLRRHDEDWGEGWKTADPAEIFASLATHAIKLNDRAAELATAKGAAVATARDRVLFASGDVGNFAMMYAWLCVHAKTGEV